MPENLEDDFSNALAVKFVMAGVSMIGLAALYFILPYEPWVIELCLLLALASIVRSFAYLFESVCRARERLDLEGASLLTSSVLFVGSSLTFLYFDYPVIAVGWASLGSAFAHCAISGFFATRFIRIRLTLPPKWSVVRAALPYATTSLSLLAFAQIDILIISFIESTEFVGRYSSVSRLLLIAGTLGALLTSAVLPTASRIFATATRHRFDEIFNGALRVIFSAGMAAGLATVVLARWVIQLIYGESFLDLYPTLQWGAVYLVIKFGVSVLAMVLTSSARQGDRARGVVIGLISTVFLVFALVPSFGIKGAVVAMILSELVLLACFLFALQEHLDWRGLLQTMSCLSLAGGAALATYGHFADGKGATSIAASIVAPLIAYLLVLFATGEGMCSIRFILGLRGAR